FQSTDICLIGPSIADCTRSAGSNNSGSSYNFGLDYQLTDRSLLYVTARQGYKRGGFNMIASLLGGNTLFAYPPEYVNDVDLGTKTDWTLPAMPSRTTLAFYNSRYRDAQVLSAASVAGTIQGITVNAAKATIRGAELQATLVPIEGLEINLGYS